MPRFCTKASSTLCAAAPKVQLGLVHDDIARNPQTAFHVRSKHKPKSFKLLPPCRDAVPPTSAWQSSKSAEASQDAQQAEAAESLTLPRTSAWCSSSESAK